MTETAELFARMTCAIEDMHGIAIEGQAADIPVEANKALAAHLTNGMRRAGSSLEVIERSIGSKP